jgi:hypothetical protein
VSRQVLRPELTAIDIHFSHKLTSRRPEIFNSIGSFNSLPGMPCDGFDELKMLLEVNLFVTFHVP